MQERDLLVFPPLPFVAGSGLLLDFTLQQLLCVLGAGDLSEKFSVREIAFLQIDSPRVLIPYVTAKLCRFEPRPLPSESICPPRAYHSLCSITIANCGEPLNTNE